MCGIWKHREATCATWFCRFERGKVGFEFWQHLRNFLQLIERQLSLSFARELGIDPVQLRAFLPATPGGAEPEAVLTWSELEGQLDPTAYAVLWGSWAGREEEYYDRCRELAESMSWPQILAACGQEAAIRADLVRRQYDLLVTPSAPERLVPGPINVHGRRQDGLRAVTYSVLDAIDLPAPLLTVLHAFDGRPTAEILDHLRSNGFEITDEFLQELVDWGVLVDADGGPSASAIQYGGPSA
jgi:hypothetical protein